MRQLLIDTCTERGFIAYHAGSTFLFAQELPFGLHQSQALMPQLAEACTRFSIGAEQVDCIGVAIGPGSYTGIRIGVSVAQALAFAWQRPLVGVCSLNALVPEEVGVRFAAILDARIGGVYLRKGISHAHGVEFLSVPMVCSLAEAAIELQDVTHLVTPHATNLRLKLEGTWQWQERSPSIPLFASLVETAFQQGAWLKEGHLELLYLRETEAEREKAKKQATGEMFSIDK